MIIKQLPEEFRKKPLISDPGKGDSQVYLGRVIIELWGEKPLEHCEDPAFAWSVDDSDLPIEQWQPLLLKGLREAADHIESSYHAQQTQQQD